MKLSADGPDIPNDLIDATIRGEVVFLCGAGVSQPSGFPDFCALTERIFKKLGLCMSDPERHSFKQGRYEETLGLLSRRLADRRSLYIAVAGELDAGRATDTSSHATVLRLSCDFEGRPVIVTTNFDTLFERALNEQTGEPVADKSFAGAQVPAPAAPRFEGIIHLHGRLADQRLDLDQSDLVLTSADYGDAYLRSGWAARFLYDLARTRIIVLVGYSASDAPVRYILNILEADRERFPDLKDIFVLADSAGLDMTAASTVWDAIAVKPIIFNAPNGDFRSFWRDMAAWADLVELPLQWRKSRLATFATREVRDLPEWEREQAIWIFRHQDAMGLLGQLPFAPEWIAFFRAQRLFDRRSDWPLAQWAATRLGSMQAFQEVLSSADTLTTSAAFVLERALDAKDRRSIPASLEKAWRLFIEVLHQPPPTDRWAHYGAFARIKAGTAFRNDLRRIVQLFTPRMRMRSQYPSYQQTEEVLTLFSVCRIEFECMEYPSLQDFLKVLPAGSPYLCPLLQRSRQSRRPNCQPAFGLRRLEDDWAPETASRRPRSGVGRMREGLQYPEIACFLLGAPLSSLETGKST